MLPSLLDYSLERINSLQHFYHLESTHINQLSTDGMRKNCFGYYADRYFAMLTNPDWDENGEVEKLKKDWRILLRYLRLIRRIRRSYIELKGLMN